MTFDSKLRSLIELNSRLKQSMNQCFYLFVGVGGKPMTEFTHQEKWKKSLQAGSSGLASRMAHNHRYK